MTASAQPPPPVDEKRASFEREALVHLDTLFGVEPDSPLPIIVQLSYCGVFAAGCAWVGWLWVFRRNVYDALGHRETVTVGGA